MGIIYTSMEYSRTRKIGVNKMEEAIFKGDDLRAFGGHFLTIKILNPDLYKISKIVFVVNNGVIIKEFTDENFFQVEETLLSVDFTSSDTMKLSNLNVGNVIAYDENGYKETCIQSIKFYAQNGVICNAKCSC